MFLSVMQWSDHCVLWQIFLCVFLFGLLPLLCVWFAVSFDETQVWLGDLRVVWLFRVMWGCYDLPAVSDLFGPCTNDFFTAYAHVRTEPQRDIGHTRGKKTNGIRRSSTWASSNRTGDPELFQQQNPCQPWDYYFDKAPHFRVPHARGGKH